MRRVSSKRNRKIGLRRDGQYWLALMQEPDVYYLDSVLEPAHTLICFVHHTRRWPTRDMSTEYAVQGETAMPVCWLFPPSRHFVSHYEPVPRTPMQC